MPEGFVVSDLLPNSDISSLVNMDASSLYHCKLSGATLATLAIELISGFMYIPFNQKKKFIKQCTSFVYSYKITCSQNLGNLICFLKLFCSWICPISFL